MSTCHMSFDIVSREWAMRAAALELVNYERPAWALTIARDTEPRMSLYPRWIFRVYITCTSAWDPVCSPAVGNFRFGPCGRIRRHRKRAAASNHAMIGSLNQAVAQAGITERQRWPNCCPREAGLGDRTTLLPAVEPLAARPAAVGRLPPVDSWSLLRRQWYLPAGSRLASAAARRIRTPQLHG
jgi:hypothetical protein